jgi:hypothetical protein
VTNQLEANAGPIGPQIQDKAKSAHKKGSALVGEIGNITKGNLAATAESGKILRIGLQQLGTGYVADGRAMFETLSDEVRELAAVKSPIDFFKLQGEFVRRNFDAVFAVGSKNSQAILKLAQAASAPLAEQVKAVVETVRKVA